MGEGACIKKMVAIRNYSTNTIIEKNKQRGKGEGGLRIWIFRDKVKDLNIFQEYPIYSVLISLGHFELHFWLCQPQARKTAVV